MQNFIFLYRSNLKYYDENIEKINPQLLIFFNHKKSKLNFPFFTQSSIFSDIE